MNRENRETLTVLFLPNGPSGRILAGLCRGWHGRCIFFRFITGCPMSQILVKLADFKVSNNREDLLVVYGLGSTAAVILYDSGAGVGGIVHYMLSSSISEPHRAKEYPAMFADVAIPLLVQSCIRLEARRELLTARLAGGSILLSHGISRSISEGNISAAKRILSDLGIPLTVENTGGNHNRALRLEIATGKALLKRPDGGWEEMR